MPVSIPKLPAPPEAAVGPNQSPPQLPLARKDGSEAPQDFGAMLSNQDTGPIGDAKTASASAAPGKKTKGPFIQAAVSGMQDNAGNKSKTPILSSSKAPSTVVLRALKETASNLPERKTPAVGAIDSAAVPSPIVPLPELSRRSILGAVGATAEKRGLGEGQGTGAPSQNRTPVVQVPLRPGTSTPAGPETTAAPDANATATAKTAESISSESGGAKVEPKAGEKIAAESARTESGAVGDFSSANKHLLAAAGETLATPIKSVGTGVANSSPTMTNEAFNQSTAVAPADGMSALSSRLPGRDLSEVVEHSSSANTAVESALQVGDLQASVSQGTQSSVNLRFNVAGEELSVKVALQEGRVHTQFDTASGDLRSALAHEWQAVAPATSERGRFAEPVFTGGSRTESEVGQEGRGNQGHDAADAEEPKGSWPARTTSGSDTGEAVDTAPTAELAGRLQSFA